MDRMNLDNSQFYDIFKKEFQYKNENINFKELYRKLEDKQSPFKSLYYSEILSSSNIHALIDIKNSEYMFFFAKKKIYLKNKG